MDPTKNRGRSWLLMCLKPIDDERGWDHPTCSSFHGDESVVVGKRKKRVRRSFCMVARAIFFKSILLKKFIKEDDEKPQQDFYRLSSSLSSKSKRFVKSMKKNFSYRACWVPEEVDPPIDSSSNSSLLSSDSSRYTTSPSLSSSSSSSSSSSLSSANYSRSGSDMTGRSDYLDFGNNKSAFYRQKSMRKDCTRKSSSRVQNNYTFEMSLFVLCLGALVFLGKAFAIAMCTSTWLFFAPAHRGHRSRKVKWSVNENDVGGGG